MDGAPAVDPLRLLRQHGYGHRAKPPTRFLEAARRSISLAAEHAAPEVCLRRARIVSLANGVLMVEDGVALHCPAFDHLLAGCTEVVAFVATIGPRVEALATSLFDRDPLASLFVHSAGQLMVEATVRESRSELRGRLREEGLAPGRLLGPGYSYGSAPHAHSRCSWALEEQHELFRLFGACALPVQLLGSAGMRPKLSRSGIFGIGQMRSAP